MLGGSNWQALNRQLRGPEEIGGFGVLGLWSWRFLRLLVDGGSRTHRWDRGNGLRGTLQLRWLRCSGTRAELFNAPLPCATVPLSLSPPRVSCVRDHRFYSPVTKNDFLGRTTMKLLPTKNCYCSYSPLTTRSTSRRPQARACSRA